MSTEPELIATCPLLPSPYPPFPARSDAGYFNPDAQGNADTGQPAQDGACEACPVRNCSSPDVDDPRPAGRRRACAPPSLTLPSAVSPWHPSLCLPQINKYQPNTGQGSCLQCGAGSSTQGEGNTECQPCPLGYYSPSGDTECLPAPAGSFVGSIGATTFTPW